MSIPLDALAFIIGAMIGAAFASAALIPATLKKKRRTAAIAIALDIWERGVVPDDRTIFDTAKRVEAYLGA